MPIQGFTRARRHQFARQAVFGTKLPALRAYPMAGVPSVDLTKTDPDVDTGSIVKTVAPYLGASNITAPLTMPALDYDSIPLLMCAMFGGGVSPSVVDTSGREWLHKPAALAPLDEPDVFCYEFGDDVVTDWFQLGDGLLESLTITGPDGLGALSISSTWRFGSGSSTGSTDFPADGGVPASLTVDTAPTYVYSKDLGLFIGDNEGEVEGSGANQILNALHNFTLTITATRDQKRFSNATQSFDINAYGTTGYEVVLALVLAKTDDTVGTGSEADAWYSEDAVARFIRLMFTAVPLAGTTTPFSWDIRMPAWYYTRDDGEIGGNTTVTLTANAYNEPDTFGGFFQSDLICTLDEADLGFVAS